MIVLVTQGPANKQTRGDQVSDRNDVCQEWSLLAGGPDCYKGSMKPLRIPLSILNRVLGVPGFRRTFKHFTNHWKSMGVTANVLV